MTIASESFQGAARLARRDAAHKPGIVHLGPGAFFKAFTGTYTDELMQKEGGDWGIVAVSLHSQQAKQALHPQGCSYTSVTLGAGAPVDAVVNAISNVYALPEDTDPVLAVMSDAAIRVVSLTVTEKGYFYSPATGRLRRDAPEIIADLSTPESPRTAPGLIVRALERRWRAGIRPFTVLSCDNLPENGAVLRRVVLDFAEAFDPELAKWIAAEARFPSSMVDRITPATTDETIAALAERQGYLDLACVQHEPFRQWVIEDDFVDDDRPAWDLVGAQFVSSVTPHEKMKLRCLNGTHSALAYLGYLAGFQTISEAVAHPSMAQFCRLLWQDEIIPTLQTPEGENLESYAERLMTRYQNPGIQHRTWQIAMDGSQKMPQRLFETFEDQLKRNVVPRGICLSIAAWMRYVGGVDEQDQPIDVRDPRARALRDCTLKPSSEQIVDAFLEMDDLFSAELRNDPRVRHALSAAHRSISAQGALSAVNELLEGG